MEGGDADVPLSSIAGNTNKNQTARVAARYLSSV